MKSSVFKAFFFVGVPVALGLVALIYGALEFRAYILSSNRFAVKQMEVLTDGPADREQLIRSSGVAMGSNIFSIHLDEVRRNVEADPWVYSAMITRSLPNKIQIQYIPQKPVAILSDAEAMFYLNEEGDAFYRLQKGDSYSYPLLLVEGDWHIDGAKEVLVGALALVRGLKEQEIYSETDMGDITVRMRKEDISAPYVLTLKYPPAKLRKKTDRTNHIYTASFSSEDAGHQLSRWSAVVRYLVQQSKNPRLIRLELGKKVVVKVER